MYRLRRVKAMRTQEEINRDRELIGRSGIARRMSDYKPKVICTCSSPSPQLSHYNQYIDLTYCGKCKLLIRENNNDN